MLVLQVFGTVPPLALYSEDVPGTPNTVQTERAMAYLALSGDLCSNSTTSLNPAVDDVQVERDLTSSHHPLSDLDEDLENCAAFRRRRLRAAKLSRFFGVKYNELTGKTGTGGEAEAEAEAEAGQVDVSVSVRIDGPGRNWNHRDSNSGEDMNDVIALLRQMPRA